MIATVSVVVVLVSTCEAGDHVAFEAPVITTVSVMVVFVST